MKKIYRRLFVLSSVGLFLTSCGSKAKTLEPSFVNYTSKDIVDKEDFDAAIAEKDKGLAFADIQYSKTSYQIESSRTVNVTTAYQYENGVITDKSVERLNTAKLYNHSDDVITYDIDYSIKNENSGASESISYPLNYVYQIYKQNIVLGEKNTKLYKVIQSVDVTQTFGGYVQASHALSKTYSADYVDEYNTVFADFTQVDIPLIYYVKNSTFTIGISYKDRSIPEEHNYYNEKYSVSAVCQMVIKKNNVSINVQYEINQILDNFSAEYIAAKKVDYSKQTTNIFYSEVINLNVGGTVLADSVDISKYSLGNVE